MKKLLFLVLLLTQNGFSQVIQNNYEPKPFIEVTGTAQKEITPDRIFISIILTEKTVNNQDISIQIQEDKLKDVLNKNNIDKKNLFLSDAISEVIMKKNKETGIKLTKEYTLILKNADEVTKIHQDLAEANIKEITIKRTEYSEMEIVRKEVREKAIKAAKEKAEYLLIAIGEQIGKPIEIKEVENQPYRSLNTNLYIPSDDESKEINFEKITVKFSYYIKYSIK